LTRQRKKEQTEEMHRGALGLKEKGHPYTLASMNNLALVLSNKSEYEQAKEIHEQVLGAEGDVAR
jgi:hypothetical protein